MKCSSDKSEPNSVSSTRIIKRKCKLTVNEQRTRNISNMKNNTTTKKKIILLRMECSKRFPCSHICYPNGIDSFGKCNILFIHRWRLNRASKNIYIHHIDRRWPILPLLVFAPAAEKMRQANENETKTSFIWRMKDGNEEKAEEKKNYTYGHNC